MSNISRVRAITISIFDTNTLDPAVWKVLTPSLEEACFLVRFTNTSAGFIYISYDGVNHHDIVLGNDYFDLYFQNNASYSEKNNNLAKGTKVWLLGAAAIGRCTLTGYTYVD